MRTKPCRRRRAASRWSSGFGTKRASASKARAPRDRRYDWAHIFGAACPARDKGAALVLPRANAEAFYLHLKEISRRVAKGAHAVVLIDGPGGHGALEVPDNITLIRLPPYSLELNAAENIRDYLRKNRLASSVFETYDDIVEACSKTWNFYADDPNVITSIIARDWAKISA